MKLHRRERSPSSTPDPEVLVSLGTDPEPAVIIAGGYRLTRRPDGTWVAARRRVGYVARHPQEGDGERQPSPTP